MFPLPKCESPRNTQQRQPPLGKMEEEMKILEGKITQSPIWKNDRPDRSPAKSGLPRNTVQIPIKTHLHPRRGTACGPTRFGLENQRSQEQDPNVCEQSQLDQTGPIPKDERKLSMS